MIRPVVLFTLSLSVCVALAQDRSVGGPCEGCEAIFEHPKKELNAVDTLPGFGRFRPAMLVTGRVLRADGSSPAPGVIVYIYHTDREGNYASGATAKGWERRHGRYRGWVRTGTDGRYSFYTFRPASYPGTRIPQHIHMTVREPGLTPYYIDSIHFTDDPFLTDDERRSAGERGGPGIATPVSRGNLLVVTRDILLGVNIPGYPAR